MFMSGISMNGSYGWKVEGLSDSDQARATALVNAYANPRVGDVLGSGRDLRELAPIVEEMEQRLAKQHSLRAFLSLWIWNRPGRTGKLVALVRGDGQVLVNIDWP